MIPKGVDFKALFESVPNLYLILDPELRIVAVSDSFLRATFIKRENLIGKYVFEVFHQPSGPKIPVVENIPASLKRALNLRILDRMEFLKYDIPKPQGFADESDKRYWSPLNTPLYDERGAVKYIIHQADRCVPSVQQAESKLEAAMQKRTTILNSITDAFCSVDQEWHFTYMNPSAEQQLQKATQGTVELFGPTIWQLVPTLDGTRFEQELRRVMHERRPAYFEETFHPLGLTYQVNAYPSAEGLSILFRDVTELKRDEGRLRMLESVATTANDSVVTTEAGPIDAPGPRITYVNEAFTTMSGYTAEEVLGRDPRFMQGPGTDPSARSRIRSALEQKKPVRVEMLNYRKDGSEFWVDISIAPVIDKEGRLIHWTSVQRETTARRKAEATALNLIREEAAAAQSEIARKQVTEILESIADAFFALDSQWCFTYVNRRAAEFFGRDQCQLIGKEIWKELPETAQSSFGRICREAAEQKIKIELEDYSAEHMKWFNITAYPSENGVSVYFQDVTDRKQIELEQKHLIAILEATPDFVASLDVGGHPLYLNRASRDLLGGDIGRDSAIFITEAHPDWAAALLLSQGIPTAMRDGTWTGESAVINRAGKEVPVSQVLIAHRDQSNNVQYFSTIARDLTERKKVEKSQQLLVEASKVLTASLEFEKTIGDLVPLITASFADFCVISLIDKKSEIRKVAAIHKDTTKQDLLQRFDCFVGELKAPVGIRHALQSGTPELVSGVTDPWLIAASQTPEELQAIRELNPSSIIIAPMRAHGKTLGAILFAVTEPGSHFSEADLILAQELASRVAFASENAHLYKESQQATSTRDEVLRIVAHDLRNPVAAISLSVETILSQLPSDSDQIHALLNVIHRSAHQANRLIQDLLDVAKMESRQLILEKEIQKASPLVQESVELLRALAEQKKLHLVAKIADDLPAIKADRDRFLQVFSNLIGNAIKFTPPGGTITVSAEPAPSHIRFSVSDSGRGIPAAEISNLFKPFWQAKTVTKEGTGLGLAITKGIVEAHGGHIWAESKEGIGSTFLFEIPTAELQTESPKARRDEVHQPIHGKRVLVVDDSPEMRIILRQILERVGMVVTEATSLEEALSSVANERPDVVITDIELPDGKGYDVVERFHTLEKTDGIHTPVAALTGHTDAEETQKILKAGFDTQLSKPVSANNLLSSIQKMVDQIGNQPLPDSMLH